LGVLVLALDGMKGEASEGAPYPMLGDLVMTFGEWIGRCVAERIVPDPRCRHTRTIRGRVQDGAPRRTRRGQARNPRAGWLYNPADHGDHRADANGAHSARFQGGYPSNCCRPILTLDRFRPSVPCSGSRPEDISYTALTAQGTSIPSELIRPRDISTREPDRQRPAAPRHFQAAYSARGIARQLPHELYRPCDAGASLGAYTPITPHRVGVVPLARVRRRGRNGDLGGAAGGRVGRCDLCGSRPVRARTGLMTECGPDGAYRRMGADYLVRG
jgi:hypothetical protein